MPLTRSPAVRGETPTNGATTHDHRRALEALAALAGAVGPGVIDGCAVTGTASWQYAVAPGFLATRRSATDGMNVWSNTTQYLVSTDPAPGIGSRLDIIYALHNDKNQSDPDSQPVIDVAKGTAIPAGAIELARKVVASGDISTSAGTPISLTNQARTGSVGGQVLGGADQSIPAGATTALTFPSAATTLLGGVTYSGGVLTVPTPGWYRISVYVRALDSTSGGNFELRIRLNGAVVGMSSTAYHPGGAWIAGADVYIAESSTIDAFVNQASGGTIRVANSLGSPRLTAVRIG